MVQQAKETAKARLARSSRQGATVITATDQIKHLHDNLKKLWLAGMGVIISLVIGFVGGKVYGEGQIIEDCKVANSFRVGVQAFNCQKK